VSDPDGKAAIERLLDAFSRGDFDGVEDVLAPDFVNHGLPPVPGATGDRAGVLAAMRYLRTAFPDARAEPVSIVAEGDRVGVHDRLVGTHRGDYRGVAPTGREIRVDFIHVFRVEGSCIVERWGVVDTTALMQQLGA
jgi:predicted ester cyclase